MTRISQERFSRKSCWVYTHGNVTQRTMSRDYMSYLAWFHLCVGPAEISEIAVNRDVFCVLLGLLRTRPSPEKKRVCKWLQRRFTCICALRKINACHNQPGNEHDKSFKRVWDITTLSFSRCVTPSHYPLLHFSWSATSGLRRPSQLTMRNKPRGFFRSGCCNWPMAAQRVNLSVAPNHYCRA